MDGPHRRGTAPSLRLPDVPEPAHRVPLRPGDIWLQEGFTLEPVVVGLNVPTFLTLDDASRLYVGEGGSP
ncbi:hypothetical protein LIP_2187 [Limnochorda pilosa]|uniref:Uncharacterized protein n=1 Tax=Limnochorda pilosa TaxID=1555112 RepID=A0A0K2SLN2_LIMPI|nr:hypothetical protein LIP_2187 [Limnochorda pilosa]